MKYLNCCQKVLINLNDLSGFSEEEAENLGAGFGGGATVGELCGAASGAVISLGKIFGDTDIIARNMTIEFQKRFKERVGNYRCSDILGYDMTDAEQAKKCMESGVKKEVCPNAISSAEEIVREIVRENLD